MATFIDLVSQKEQLEELISFYITLLKDKEQPPIFKTWSESQENTKALLVWMIEQNELVFSASDRDIETCWNAIFSQSLKLEEGEEEGPNSIRATLLRVLTSSTSSSPLIRLKVLSNIYNFANSSVVKYDTLYSIFEYAKNSNQQQTIYPVLSKAEGWLEEWNVTTPQKRKMYKLLCDIMMPTKEDGTSAYRMLGKYLNTFEEENEENKLKEARPLAVVAAVLAIKLNDIHQCDDLLKLKAVQQLNSDDEGKLLFELLSLFASEKLNSFDEFHKNNPNFLESVGLSYDDCHRKIRLLSLATLATENSVLPYSVIANALHVEEAEVEEWIVIAISAGLLTAKMNQLKQELVVHQCTQRVFGEDLWSQLEGKLEGWKKNIDSLLTTLEESKPKAK